VTRGGCPRLGKVLHIIPASKQYADVVMFGVNLIPIHGLAVISREEDLLLAKAQADLVSSLLGLKVTVKTVKKADAISFAKSLSELISELSEFDELVMNLGAADKELSVSAVVVATVLGIKTFNVENGDVSFLPTMGVPLLSIISDEKVVIVETLYDLGGKVSKLETLAKKMGISRALLSYHINGSARTPGLVQLGLVGIKRKGRSSIVELTDVGKIFALASKIKKSMKGP